MEFYWKQRLSKIYNSTFKLAMVEKRLEVFFFVANYTYVAHIFDGLWYFNAE